MPSCQLMRGGLQLLADESVGSAPSPQSLRGNPFWDEYQPSSIEIESRYVSACEAAC